MSNLSLERQLIEDEAHVSGDPGNMMFAVRNDTLASLVDTDGDYAPVQVDASGALYVSASISSISLDSEYAEDSAHTTADVGQHVLLVRQDTLAASNDADGDYGSFKSTSTGELYVHDADINALITALSKAEDSAHVSGDQGIQMLSVRKDSQTALAGTDGDYQPLITDDNGRLYVVADIDLTGDLVGDGEVDTEDPLKVGSHAYDQASAWSSVDAGDKANLASDLYRRILINDAPNVSSAASKITVGTSEAAIPNDDLTITTATPLAGRTRMIVQNRGNKSIFVGPTGVTTSTGIEVGQKASLSLEIGESVDLFAISTDAGQNVRVLELA